ESRRSWPSCVIANVGSFHFGWSAGLNSDQPYSQLIVVNAAFRLRLSLAKVSGFENAAPHAAALTVCDSVGSSPSFSSGEISSISRAEIKIFPESPLLLRNLNGKRSTLIAS